MRIKTTAVLMGQYFNAVIMKDTQEMCTFECLIIFIYT